MRAAGASGRDGFVLVAVLGVMALLAGLVGAASILSRASIDSARTGSEDLIADELVRAGIELAGYQLFALNLPGDRVHQQQVRLEGGVVTLFVASEGGKVDLNGADEALLAGVYRAAGLTALSPTAFAARIVDWRDEDNELTEEGAEAAEYGAAGLDYSPQNDAFRSVGDLRWILGLSPSDVAALSEITTVHNPDGKVDVFEAPRRVLISLPNLTSSAINQILASRAAGRTAGTIDLLASLLAEQKDNVKFTPGPSYLVRVEARREGRIARTAEAVLTRSVIEDAAYHVVDWLEQ